MLGFIEVHPVSLEDPTLVNDSVLVRLDAIAAISSCTVESNTLPGKTQKIRVGHISFQFIPEGDQDPWSIHTREPYETLRNLIRMDNGGR